MDEADVVYTYNKMLFRHIKQGNLGTYYDMDKGNYTK